MKNVILNLDDEFGRTISERIYGDKKIFSALVAASGKVNRGDVISIIQHKGQKFSIYDVASFNEALQNFSSGDKIAMHLLRNGQRLIRSVTLN